MKVLSDAQFDAWNAKHLAPIEEVRDGIWAVPLPLPVRGLPWVFSYFLEDSGGDLHLIDAGWNSDESWSEFEAALGHLGKRMSQVKSVTVTHFHPDHLGMAERIRHASGARVGLLQREQATLHVMKKPEEWEAEHERDMLRWGVPRQLWSQLHAPAAVGVNFPTFDADLELVDDQVLDLPGRTVRVLATPGHTSGELSLHDAEAGILFSGDHLLPNQFPGIGLGGESVSNPFAEYFAALDRVVALGDVEVDPGHGYRFGGVAERCEVTRQHHLARSAEIAAILDRGADLTVWQVAEQVTWTAGWQNLRASELLSAVTQTALHIDYLASR